MMTMTISNKRQLNSFLARPLGLELVVASVLLALAFTWQAFRPVQLLPRLTWSFGWLSIGLVAALLPLLMIPLLESSVAQRWIGLRDLRDNVDALLAPLLGDLGCFEMVALAVLAGLSEEVFFRGVLQQEIGLLAASLLFGLLHPASIAYMVWAAAVGLYLGYLMHLTQNLWPSIVAHMVIDVVGLCYLRLVAARRCDTSQESMDSL